MKIFGKKYILFILLGTLFFSVQADKAKAEVGCQGSTGCRDIVSQDPIRDTVNCQNSCDSFDIGGNCILLTTPCPPSCSLGQNSCPSSQGSINTYRYESKGGANGDCVCNSFQAKSIDDAAAFLNDKIPLPEPCHGNAKDLAELVTLTDLKVGDCPQVNSTQQITYHCTVVDDKVGKNTHGACVEFTSTDNEANAKAEGDKVCANSSGSADRVQVEKGTCASPGGLAGTSVDGLKASAAKILNQANFSGPTDIINRAIKILLAFIGSIALVLYIYSGFLWMTASGGSDQVEKAKTTMVWTTLGVVMMLASYVLASFIFKSLGV